MQRLSSILRQLVDFRLVVSEDSAALVIKTLIFKHSEFARSYFAWDE
jgi:hypothetical protein